MYAEEIVKSLGQNQPSDLIGHTMYKAPTLSTAAVPGTSPGTLPKRQSLVLCNYYIPNNTVLSRGNFEDLSIEAVIDVNVDDATNTQIVMEDIQNYVANIRER